MYRDGGLYVSEHAKKEAFKNLELDRGNDGKRNGIEEAIEIFKDRIESRYLSQINKLNEKVFENGFASMALCCLLIDTFYQYEYGDDTTNNNKAKYIKFLRTQMKEIFDTNEKAEHFYVDIRCGILHSAQTKNESRLAFEQTSAVEMIGDDSKPAISVDVRQMGEALETYFSSYCRRVIEDDTTQDNFVKKMKLAFKL